MPLSQAHSSCSPTGPCSTHLPHAPLGSWLAPGDQPHPEDLLTTQLPWEEQPMEHLQDPHCSPIPSFLVFIPPLPWLLLIFCTHHFLASSHCSLSSSLYPCTHVMVSCPDPITPRAPPCLPVLIPSLPGLFLISLAPSYHSMFSFPHSLDSS